MNIMRFPPVLVPITAAMLLAGCGSSTSASKSNFAKAINDAFAKDCITYDPRANTNMITSVNGSQYPVTVTGFNQQAFEAFDGMVMLGLLTSKNVKNSYAPTKTYTLTPAGEKALKSKNGTAFCAGHWQVKQVTNFTTPGKAATGATTSTVQFTEVAVDLPKWTARYTGLKKALSGQRNGTAQLVLTNNGWEATIGTE